MVAYCFVVGGCGGWLVGWLLFEQLVCGSYMLSGVMGGGLLGREVVGYRRQRGKM
jgi:hypothetical protein